MLRARAKYYEEGDKPSRFFLNMEKRNYTNKFITRLIVNGKVIESQKEILEEQKKFYHNLYSQHVDENKEEIEKFLGDENIRPITEQQARTCEGQITEVEIKRAIKGMKNGKTPGSDGFPVEFYKVFWVDLGIFLTNSLNFAFTREQLSKI